VIMAPQRYRGRTHTHQHQTDDAMPVLGADIAIHDEHRASVRQTKSRDRELTTKRDMCNRLKHIMDFWKEKYPDYYTIGVHELTEEELSDSDKFFYKNKHDIVYTGLNVDFVLYFMADKKTKANGKTASHVQIRKYKDAILWGAGQAKTPLPSSYYDEMQSYLQSFKKETAAAKTEGQLDKQEADPITPTFFRCILNWAVEGRNIFIWVFSLCQWHFMACSINIGTLALHNFHVGKDHGIVQYDKTKADQTGEKVHDKHFYDIPNDSLVSIFWLWACGLVSEVRNLKKQRTSFKYRTHCRR